MNKNHKQNHLIDRHNDNKIIRNKTTDKRNEKYL